MKFKTAYIDRAEQPPFVIYHGNCADGFTAAWALTLAFPNAELFKGVHGDPLPNVANRNVIMVDFSYKLPEMYKLMAEARTIVVLDHHKSAEAELQAIVETNYAHVEIIFDMNKSGARLAWEWGLLEHVPNIVRYVEDRDLWRFKLPNSREISAAMFSYEYSLGNWSRLMHQLEDPGELAKLVDEGAAIERKHLKDVSELVEKTKQRMVIGGVEVWVANLPYTMSSDAAHLLAAPDTFGACFYVDNSGRPVFSLRSHARGMDVSAIAQLYNGGGHKHAAGFRLQASNEFARALKAEVAWKI